MVQIKAKTTVPMAMTATGETHARSRVTSRDVTATIDEPEARGGTNQGLSPTETLMSSLIGCTNVIAHRIAEKMGVEMGEMQISLGAEFHRMGAMLEEEVEVPFSNVTMEIQVATNASAEQLKTIQTDLARFCPVAKVLRGAGISITENWTATPL